ncbi:MAG: DUF177 domain-containing protein [Deltaproteobacteria bacterium]|nr:DUF177 domain-containing protein [Deltaproteobacteria bacterium]
MLFTKLVPMMIDLRTISRGARHFDFTFEPDWWRGMGQYDQVLGLDVPLEVHIEISKAGDKYVIDGNLRGGIQVRCDRCLEPYHDDLESSFRLFSMLAPPDMGESEVELSEEDLSVDFMVGDEIDPEGIVREQVYLSLPMKTLCKEDCLGLCPLCGANLNMGPCACKGESGHPGFRTLKNITYDGE